MFSWVSVVFKFLKGLDFRVLLLVLIFLLSGFTFWQMHQKKQLKDRLQVQSNNIEALTDSTRKYKTRNGELGKEKLSLQVTIEDLEKANKDLYEEVEKEKGNVKTITKTKTVIKNDTVFVDSSRISQVGLNDYKINWSYYDEGEDWFRKLEGFTQFKYDSLSGDFKNIQTIITSDEIDLSIVTGIREKDGKKTIFVRSSYPNIDFVEINGAIIDDNIYSKPSRWGIGPVIGYGINSNGQTGIYAGIGINFQFIRL